MPNALGRCPAAALELEEHARGARPRPLGVDIRAEAECKMQNARSRIPQEDGERRTAEQRTGDGVHRALHMGYGIWDGSELEIRNQAPGSSPNLTDLRPQNRTPCTGNLVPDTSRRDGRAGRAPLTPRRAPGAPKCARRPCNDTQEKAKKIWSCSYGGLS
jgi:hypothetical protein